MICTEGNGVEEMLYNVLSTEIKGVDDILGLLSTEDKGMNDIL